MNPSDLDVRNVCLQKNFLSYRKISELNDYQKVRVLGGGAFGKVYLLRKREGSQACSSWQGHHKPETEFAAKFQAFNGGPNLNRREAMIMKELVNPEVSVLW